MPDALMYEEEMFVVLETNQPEAFLTPEALLVKLKDALRPLQESLPLDLQDVGTLEAQAQKLMDTSCELTSARSIFAMVCCSIE